MIISPNKWLVCHQKNENAKHNLICFPFGGAAASAYRPLAKELEQNCNVWSVQLPGRENRFAQPFVTEANVVAAAVFNEIKLLGLKSYSIFGHSMGSDLALEFCRQVEAAGGRRPDTVVLSGNKPPHVSHDKLWSESTDASLIDHVLSLGGIPKDALTDKDFVAMYLKKIRCDYQLYESVKISQPKPLASKLTVIYGSADPLLERIDMKEWSKYSENDVKLIETEGGHFYFQPDCRRLASLIVDAIAGE